MLGLDGYCPVCITANSDWVKGSPAIQAEYDGRTYQFPGDEQKQAFIAAPADFAPALGGDDIVEFSRGGERISGRVQHAMRYNGRLYLFASAQNRDLFQRNPTAFVNSDLALNGECVVCRVNMQQRVAGKPEFTAIYGGFRYLFPGEEQRAMFIASPETYVPAASAGTARSGPAAGSGARPSPPPAGSGSGSR